MLLSFSARNFRSIYNPQEVSFIATKYASLPEAVVAQRDVAVGVLPLIAIYGANAAGKTNILRALHTFCDAIVRSYNRWDIETFLPADTHFFHQDEPVEFEARFLVAKRVFKFGCTFDRKRILKEFLTSGKETLYRRRGNSYRFGRELDGFTEVKKNTRSNSLFISAGAQANHPTLRAIHNWFATWDTITDQRDFEQAFTVALLRAQHVKRFLVDAVSIIMPDIVDIIPSDKKQDLPKSLDPVTADLLRNRRDWEDVVFVHKEAKTGRLVNVPLTQESSGTKSYFALIGTISSVLIRGGLLILDEADQSLHPTLLRSIVGLFQSPSTNARHAQIVFNTHDTTLLSPETLRPDQVWFAEKDSEESSRIICLADFKGVRSETKAQRAYLEGRFGAVPFLEDNQRIFSALVNAKREMSRGKKKSSEQNSDAA